MKQERQNEIWKDPVSLVDRAEQYERFVAKADIWKITIKAVVKGQIDLAKVPRFKTRTGEREFTVIPDNSNSLVVKDFDIGEVQEILGDNSGFEYLHMKDGRMIPPGEFSVIDYDDENGFYSEDFDDGEFQVCLYLAKHEAIMKRYLKDESK